MQNRFREPVVGLISRHYRNSSKRHSDRQILQSISQELHHLGVKVKVISNGDLASDINCSHVPWRAVLSMSRAHHTLCLLQAWQELGLLVINSPESVMRVLNRPMLFSLLYKSGVSTPTTIWGKGGQIPNGVNWVIKSANKSFRDFNEGAIVSKSAWYVYQHLIPSCRQAKTYMIGSDRYIEKHSEALTRSEKSIIRAATLKCQEVLGLSLLSIDFVLDKENYYVVDVNDFPSFHGIDEAPKWIANLIINQLPASISI